MNTNSTKPILISFVNHHFGPIRGLNFLVDEEQNESLDSWLQTQPDHLISAIWAQTALSTRAMIMPNQMLDELETPPKKVSSIQEGEVEILKVVRKGTLTGDPFFFRSFIL
jgi:hypothetical protein